MWPAAGAVALHGGYHLLVALRMAGGPDMHFFAALSLVALGMAALTTLFGARGRMAALGVLVFPLATALLLAYHGHGHAPSKGRSLRSCLALPLSIRCTINLVGSAWREYTQRSTIAIAF